ncbi:hypothetical protein Tco_0242362 [Tanacetum coccineum]
MKHTYSNDDTCFSIDVIDEILEADFNALLDEGREIIHSIKGTILEEKLFAKFDEFMAMNIEENSESESDTEEPPFEKITFNTDYKIKTSLEEPLLDLELKPLPNHLEYVFLEEPVSLEILSQTRIIDKFIKPRFSLDDDDDGIMTRKYFLAYTTTKIQQFRDTLIKHMEYVKKSIGKRALHKREYNSRVNERQMQTKEGKVDTSKALDASLVDTESSGTKSEKQDISSSSGNDADIKPVYDEEPMAEVQLTAECNVFAIGQQHTEQLEFNNEGEVDQDVEQCHDIRPFPVILTNNQITELSNQSLESKNIWQHGQFSKLKSNEAKVKHDIDVIETINIKLEHKVAKLLKENETLKKHYKELYDSIKTTRAKIIEQTTSLIAQNAEFKA